MGSRAYTLPNREQHIRENSLSFTLPERDRLARESRYDASFNPNINVDTGTAYPCTRHELALLTDERLLPTVSLPIFTAEKATSSLEDALGPYFTTSPDAVAALQRFQDKGKNPRRWGPDLMFKAFADLDRAFFGGLLRGQVLLQWRSEKYFRTVFGLVTPLAVSDLLEFALEMGRRRIVLNADQLLLHKDVELIHVWTVLLHEMIHIYLDLLTDGKALEEGHLDQWGKPDPCHGPYFERCRKAVRSRFPGDLPEVPL